MTLIVFGLLFLATCFFVYLPKMNFRTFGKSNEQLFAMLPNESQKKLFAIIDEYDQISTNFPSNFPLHKIIFSLKKQIRKYPQHRNNLLSTYETIKDTSLIAVIEVIWAIRTYLVNGYFSISIGELNEDGEKLLIAYAELALSTRSRFGQIDSFTEDDILETKELIKKAKPRQLSTL